MTIRRGEDWGEPAAIDDRVVFAASEPEAAAIIQAAFDRGDRLPTIALVSGDLHRTLGAPRHTEADLRLGRGHRFPIDVGVVTFADGRTPRVFVAHLVALEGSRLWSGRTITAMNAAFDGALNLGPRAHPNDGLLDVTDGSLGTRDASRARRRARLGVHLPHPDLAERRTRSYDVDSAVPLRLFLDGVRQDETLRSCRIECRPDALSVVV